MLAAFLALCCLAGWSATAAPITWSVPVTDSADTDVSTNGVLLAAYSFYNGGGTLNGVTFANSGGTSFGGNLMLSPNSAQYPGGGGGGNLSPAYQTLLANGLWSLPGWFYHHA